MMILIILSVIQIEAFKQTHIVNFARKCVFKQQATNELEANIPNHLKIQLLNV